MTNPDPRLVHTPFFLPGPAGKLFALHLRPAGPELPKNGILFFPPFAEEMNKSRRMVSLQARRMAALGYQVLLIDLFGTGDSEGDFVDARWEGWRADMRTAVHWLQNNGARRLVLWGARLGALLAMETEVEFREVVDGVLLWQPVLKGESYLTQFLRLRIAGEMTAGGDKLTTADLRRVLQDGDTVEVAGYTLHPELGAAIDLLPIDDQVAGAPAPMACFQVTLSGQPTAVGKRLLALREPQGSDTRMIAMTGEQFWQSAEITVVEDLLAMSTDWLENLP